MKTTTLLKSGVLVAMMIAGVANSEVKAQESFITNEETSGELVVAKTIFKKDGAFLYNHMRYIFTYDDQNRLIGKEALTWYGSKWTPYFKMTYQYNDNEISMIYGRWNSSRKAYDEAIEKSVYELNDQNMPTAYRTFKQADNEKSDWTLVNFSKLDNNNSLLANTK